MTEQQQHQPINSDGKYAVFPLDRVQQLLNQSSSSSYPQVHGQIASTVSTDIGNLDSQIQEILYDPKNIYPSNNMKIKALRELIVKFVQANREFREPVRMSIEETSSSAAATTDAAANESTGSEQRFPNNEKFTKMLGNAAGPKFKNKALTFLQHLQHETPDFGWNEHGELKIVGQEAIAGSSVITILIDAVKPHRKTAQFPAGFLEFRLLLKRNNVSEMFYNNKERYSTPAIFKDRHQPPPPSRVVVNKRQRLRGANDSDDDNVFEDASEEFHPLPTGGEPIFSFSTDRLPPTFVPNKRTAAAKRKATVASSKGRSNTIAKDFRFID
jgi:hypothetical protein